MSPPSRVIAPALVAVLVVGVVEVSQHHGSAARPVAAAPAVPSAHARPGAPPSPRPIRVPSPAPPGGGAQGGAQPRRPARERPVDAVVPAARRAGVPEAVPAATDPAGATG